MRWVKDGGCHGNGIGPLLIGVPESFRARLLIAFALTTWSKVDDEANGSVGSRQKRDGGTLVLEERIETGWVRTVNEYLMGGGQ